MWYKLYHIDYRKHCITNVIFHLYKCETFPIWNPSIVLTWIRRYEFGVTGSHDQILFFQILLINAEKLPGNKMTRKGQHFKRKCWSDHDSIGHRLSMIPWHWTYGENNFAYMIWVIPYGSYAIGHSKSAVCLVYDFHTKVMF